MLAATSSLLGLAKANLEARIAPIRPPADESMVMKRVEKPLGLEP
jgi:hypothetical protein